MINTYSTKEDAIAAIPEFCKIKEQDIFVCHVCYPFGEEWSLRTRDQIFSEESFSIIHKYYLPINHHFIERDNAIREKQVWEMRLNTEIELERHTKVKKGYPTFSHYTLNT